MLVKKLKFRKIAATITAATGILTSATAFAVDFKQGQRWSCITDQGAKSFVDIHRVEGKDVSFSWGVLDPTNNEFVTLCDQSDALSADEMIEFCQVLGDEFSNGHVLLQKGCEG